MDTFWPFQIRFQYILAWLWSLLNCCELRGVWNSMLTDKIRLLYRCRKHFNCSNMSFEMRCAHIFDLTDVSIIIYRKDFVLSSGFDNLWTVCVLLEKLLSPVMDRTPVRIAYVDVLVGYMATCILKMRTYYIKLMGPSKPVKNGKTRLIWLFSSQGNQSFFSWSLSSPEDCAHRCSSC